MRLVRHVMSTELTRFDEQTPLAELMDERLSADNFTSAKPRTGTSADLLVPDLAMAE